MTVDLGLSDNIYCHNLDLYIVYWHTEILFDILSLTKAIIQNCFSICVVICDLLPWSGWPTADPNLFIWSTYIPSFVLTPHSQLKLLFSYYFSILVICVLDFYQCDPKVNLGFLWSTYTQVRNLIPYLSYRSKSVLLLRSFVILTVESPKILSQPPSSYHFIHTKFLFYTSFLTKDKVRNPFSYLGQMWPLPFWRISNTGTTSVFLQTKFPCDISFLTQVIVQTPFFKSGQMLPWPWSEWPTIFNHYRSETAFLLMSLVTLTFETPNTILPSSSFFVPIYLASFGDLIPY